MSDERVKPTAEMVCTESCPSFNSGPCMVTGHQVNTVESPGPAMKTGSPCTPALDAIRGAYDATLAKSSPVLMLAERGVKALERGVLHLGSIATDMELIRQYYRDGE